MSTPSSMMYTIPAKKKQLEFINKVVDKGELRRLLARIYEEFGTAKTGNLSNALKDLGFSYATKAGVTISISDLSVPEAKKDLLNDAESEIQLATNRFNSGEITEVERYTKVIDTWSETTDKLTKLVVDNFDRLNPVYMMAFSGARGNLSQVRQLVGMRGLMADAQGQIIDLPIKSNFREGLNVTEYIISTYGARKGLVDTALKTADSGYLTRRLVDVAQDVIVQTPDCGTTNGVLMQAIIEGESIMVPLEDRLFSRTAAQDVVSEDGEVLVMAGEVMSHSIARNIAKAGVKNVLVRSALSCESDYGVCQKCYGWSLTTNKIVDVGEAIGILAAQSIGEPGTQLTMRTFHTGGVFSGGTNRDTVVVRETGELLKDIPVRDFRTRHGDVVQVTTRDITVEVKSAKATQSYSLPYNAVVFAYKKGDTVKKGDVLAEFEAGRGERRLTERATKDITSEISGEVLFEDFEIDEKRDRQGNIARTANRSGTIWIQAGEVYNLPSGSHNLIEDSQPVKEGDVLAETMVVSEHGGQVRLPADLVLETVKNGKETIERVAVGKDMTIVIASVSPKNASLEFTKKEHLLKVNKSKETYVIKAPTGTSVENGSIIAELIDDSISTPTSGEVYYNEIDVDDQRILTKPGSLFFVPCEIHPVSKDISLKMPGIDSGMKVQAGTEVVKNLIVQTSGVLEIVEENDIIHEVIVHPGEMHRVKDVGSLTVEDGTVVDKDYVVAPGIKASEKSMVTIQFMMDDPDDALDSDDLEDAASYEYAQVLLRPVQEIEVHPKKVDIRFNTSGEDDNISIVPITQLQVKNGDKIRAFEGVSLLRTSLVLQMKGNLGRFKGLTEVETDSTVEGSEEPQSGQLKVVVLENLTIRREAVDDTSKAMGSTLQTQLLVKEGDIIARKTPVVKTQVLARSEGIVSLGTASAAQAGSKGIRRLLLVTKDHLLTISTHKKPTVKVGDLVRFGTLLSADEQDKCDVSGLVVEVDAKSVVLRRARPYLISQGTQLHLEARSLALQGDLVATLIFERLKTGDIVQGLPRVEELLEGRKPKESAVISPVEGQVELVWEDDMPKLFLVSANGREEISIPLGANIIVEDKQAVTAGQPLTDGALNPHDLLLISGVHAVRKYLVDEVQRVYRSQGVEIADKHVEVIVRQMTRKMRIENSGDSILLPGELVEERTVMETVERMTAEKSENLPVGQPVLLGITKASLNTDSFISAASFQETTRVLTEAAVEAKKDILRGLKENVIIGRLIPAGTGFKHFPDDRLDIFAEDMVPSSRSSSRKPSAILEEIEHMFGSPEINEEALSSIEVDESAPVLAGDNAFDDDFEDDDDDADE